MALADLLNKRSEDNNSRQQARETEKALRQDERELGFAVITSDPAAYAQWLTVQGNSPHYSVSNVARVIGSGKLPGATHIATAEKWKAMGRTVNPSEHDAGASISAPAQGGRGFEDTPVYDIEQTGGLDPALFTLEPDGAAIETAIDLLLEYGNLDPVVDPDLDVPAFYDESTCKISINPNDNMDTLFAAVATEVAHSRFHKRGFNQQYSREESQLDAESVSYLVCRRFNLSGEFPTSLTDVQKAFDGFSVDERRQLLDSTNTMAVKMGNFLESRLNPREQSREAGAPGKAKGRLYQAR